MSDEGQLTEAGSGYTSFWIGRPEEQPKTAGVSIAIKNSVLPTLESLPKGINERLITLRIMLKGNQHVTFVSVYAPTFTNDELIKEQFYEELDKVIRDKTNDKLLIVGDFNARVGSNASNWKDILGLLGVGKENSNGFME